MLVVVDAALLKGPKVSSMASGMPTDCAVFLGSLPAPGDVKERHRLHPDESVDRMRRARKPGKPQRGVVCAHGRIQIRAEEIGARGTAVDAAVRMRIDSWKRAVSITVVGYKCMHGKKMTTRSQLPTSREDIMRGRAGDAEVVDDEREQQRHVRHLYHASNGCQLSLRLPSDARESERERERERETSAARLLTNDAMRRLPARRAGRERGAGV